MDLTNVEPSQEFEKIPEGNYKATIIKIEKTYSKSNKPMVKTTMSLEGQDSNLFDNTLVEYIDDFLELFKAKGVDDLNEKTAGIEVKHNDEGFANLVVPFHPIDAGEIVKVKLKVKRGDYNNVEKGWTNGLATRSVKSGAIYLNCQFSVVQGDFKGKSFFSLIGLHSEKGPIYSEIGLGQMKSIILSSNEIEDETAEFAQNILRDFKISNLDGIEFWCVTKIQHDEYGTKNPLGKIVIPGHKEWEAMKLTGAVASSETKVNKKPATTDTGESQASDMNNSDPSWM